MPSAVTAGTSFQVYLGASRREIFYGFEGTVSQVVTWQEGGTGTGEPVLIAGSRQRPSRPVSGGKVLGDPETGAEIIIPEGTDDVDIEQGASVANDTTGAYLLPFAASFDLGVSQPYHFRADPAAALSAFGFQGASALASTSAPRDYFFGSLTGLAFTSFVTPDGISGDTSGIVIDDGTTLTPYVPGTTFTFTKPVLAFALRGLDGSVMPPDDQPAPFLYGLTVHKPGPVIVYHAAYPTGAVPEPSTLALFAIGCAATLRAHNSTGFKETGR